MPKRAREEEEDRVARRVPDPNRPQVAVKEGEIDRSAAGGQVWLVKLPRAVHEALESGAMGRERFGRVRLSPAATPGGKQQVALILDPAWAGAHGVPGEFVFAKSARGAGPC